MGFILFCTKRVADERQPQRAHERGQHHQHLDGRGHAHLQQRFWENHNVLESELLILQPEQPVTSALVRQGGLLRVHGGFRRVQRDAAGLPAYNQLAVPEDVYLRRLLRQQVEPALVYRVLHQKQGRAAAHASADGNRHEYRHHALDAHLPLKQIALDVLGGENRLWRVHWNSGPRLPRRFRPAAACSAQSAASGGTRGSVYKIIAVEVNVNARKDLLGVAPYAVDG